MDELFEVMSTRKVIAVCIQETWRYGKEILEHGQQMIITSGLDQEDMRGKRGSQGVAIALNPDGVLAWKAAGCEAHTDLGAHVMAVCLLLKVLQNIVVGVFFISEYAPVGNAPDEVWDMYFEQLDRCMVRRQNADILIIGSDCNSSMGHATENWGGPLGYYGVQHSNDSGRRLLSYLSVNNMKVATKCFKKRAIQHGFTHVVKTHTKLITLL